MLKIDKDYRHKDKTPVVAKLIFGRKYIIIKCRKISETLKSVRRYYGGLIWDDNHLYDFILHCRESRAKELTVEIICESEKGYDILMAEHNALMDAKGYNPDKKKFYKKDADKNCLNMNKEIYINKYNPKTGKNGWIEKHEVLNFHRYKK